MASAPIAVGDSIADKYSVERVIGEGGMGVVFAARHLELDQRVAIKFLLPEIAQQGMAAERFRREARAAAKIRGEHVCRVLDVGTLTTGVPYMVMEYLDGCDLAHEIHRRGRLPPEEAVGYLIEACDAVAEAHAAGIVHRDIKPANLFLATRSDGSRRIKVLDFGVSKSLIDSNSGQHALTITSSVVGSPLYMSPEQLDSAKDVDRRTDIWALGVVLYELLTGRTPFRGDSIPQLVTSVMHDRPTSFAELAVTAPDGLEEVVHHALQKPRDKRFASIAELASSLAPYAPRHFGAMSVARSSRFISQRDGGYESARGVGSAIATGGATTALSEDSPSGSPSRPAPWAQRTTDRGSRRRWASGLVAVVVMAAVLFALYRIAGERPTESGPAIAKPAPASPITAPGAGAATAAPSSPLAPKAGLEVQPKVAADPGPEIGPRADGAANDQATKPAADADDRERAGKAASPGAAAVESASGKPTSSAVGGVGAARPGAPAQKIVAPVPSRKPLGPAAAPAAVSGPDEARPQPKPGLDPAAPKSNVSDFGGRR